jgi:mannose-6-phosphate isomerase-like protein (cupin superfamily)
VIKYWEAACDLSQLFIVLGIFDLVSLDMKYIGMIGLVGVIAKVAVVGAYATQPPLPDPLEAGWKGMPVCEKLHEDSDQRILRCTFPPSIGHQRHFHNRHFGYAIAGGRMRITDSSGTREVDLATGSSFASDGVAWHEVLNIGDPTVVFLIIEPK